MLLILCLNINLKKPYNASQFIAFLIAIFHFPPEQAVTRFYDQVCITSQLHKYMLGLGKGQNSQKAAQHCIIFLKNNSMHWTVNLICLTTYNKSSVSKSTY